MWEEESLEAGFDMENAELHRKCEAAMLKLKKQLHEEMEAKRAVAFAHRATLAPEQVGAFDAAATANLVVVQGEQDGKVAMLEAEHNDQRRVQTARQAAIKKGDGYGEGGRMDE